MAIMNTTTVGFELWDSRTHNVLQFERLDEVLVALRRLIQRNGNDAIEGLSLDAVGDDGETRLTIVEDDALLSLVTATAAR